MQQNKAPISQGGQAPRGPLNLSRRKLQCQETPQDRNLAPTEKVRDPEFNQENTSFQRTDSAGVHQCREWYQLYVSHSSVFTIGYFYLGCLILGSHFILWEFGKGKIIQLVVYKFSDCEVPNMEQRKMFSN